MDTPSTSIDETNVLRASSNLPAHFNVPTINYMKSVTRIESVDVQGSLRVCLYGEGETASVTLRPDAFHLGTLQINKSTQRELLIFNNSEALPIIFKYQKIPFVEISPKEGILPPDGGKEVMLTVVPGKCGAIQTKISFELLYYNFPKREGEYIVVGRQSATLEFDVSFEKPTSNVIACGKRNLLTEDIRFTTKVDIPKCIMPKGGTKEFCNDNALIAFPDDRPAALRPWRRTEE